MFVPLQQTIILVINANLECNREGSVRYLENAIHAFKLMCAAAQLGRNIQVSSLLVSACADYLYLLQSMRVRNLG